MDRSGLESGPGTPTSRKADRGVRSDPYTYVSTQKGMVYVPFVFDVFSRRILGWRDDTLRLNGSARIRLHVCSRCGAVGEAGDASPTTQEAPRNLPLRQ